MSTRETIFETLIDALKAVRKDDDYPDIVVHRVQRQAVNLAAIDATDELPIISLVDTGPELVQARDYAGVRYLTQLFIEAYTDAGSIEQLEPRINELLAWLRQFLEAPSLGSNVLSIFDEELMERVHVADDLRTGFILRCGLVWYAPHVAPTSRTGTVLGEDYIKQAYDLVEGFLGDLAVDLVSEDYKFSNVFRRHNVANLPLNSATFELTKAETSDDVGGVSGGIVKAVHYLTFSVRIHTAYAGGRFDSQESAYLANTVASKFLDNLDLGNLGDITGIGEIVTATEFEGGTWGSEILVELAVYSDQTQE